MSVDHKQNPMGKIPSVIEKYFLPALFILLGGIFLSIGLANIFNNAIQAKDYTETTAVITEIKGYQPTIVYEVDGKQYTNTADFYTSDMKEGGTVNILYNPKNPNYIISAGFLPYLFGTIFGGVGAIFLLVGVLLWLFIFRHFTVG